MELTHSPGRVIWITGLSAAGKTTLAKSLTAKLRTRYPNVVMLDGDELREVFQTLEPEAPYSKESRLKFAQGYASLCRLLALQGQIVVIATISLFHQIHAWNRRNIPGYFEVFIDVPLSTRKARDPKGLYQQRDIGDTGHMAGLDFPAELPINPDMVLNGQQTDINVNSKRILQRLDIDYDQETL